MNPIDMLDPDYLDELAETEDVARLAAEMRAESEFERQRDADDREE